MNNYKVIVWMSHILVLYPLKITSLNYIYWGYYGEIVQEMKKLEELIYFD